VGSLCKQIWRCGMDQKESWRCQQKWEYFTSLVCYVPLVVLVCVSSAFSWSDSLEAILISISVHWGILMESFEVESWRVSLIESLSCVIFVWSIDRWGWKKLIRKHTLGVTRAWIFFIDSYKTRDEKHEYIYHMPNLWMVHEISPLKNGNSHALNSSW